MTAGVAPSRPARTLASPNFRMPPVRQFLAPVFASACLVLAGCSPKLDATSDATLKASAQKMRDALPPEKQDEFDQALLIVLLNTWRETLNHVDPDGKRQKLLGGMTAEQVIEAAKKYKAAGPRPAAAGEAKPAPQFAGRENRPDADPAAEKSRARQNQIATVEARLAAAPARIAVLKARLAAYEFQQARLAKVKVSGAELTFDAAAERPAARLAFRVSNDLDEAVSDPTFEAVVTSPGRPEPWLTEVFSMPKAIQLAPGKLVSTSKEFSLQGGRWDKLPTDSPDLTVTIRVIGVKGADGKPVAPGRFTDADRERLQGSIEAERDDRKLLAELKAAK